MSGELVGRPTSVVIPGEKTPRETTDDLCDCWRGVPIRRGWLLTPAPCSSVSRVKAGTHRPNRWRLKRLGDSDEVGNKYVWHVQLRRKLLEPHGRCRLRLSMRSLRRRAVGRLSHWILWLVVCQLNGRSDWRCASKSGRCAGGWNTVCAL